MNKPVTKDNKLLTGIEQLLGAWPLLRGVVDSGWREREFRKISDLADYFESGKYKFHTMSNRELECAFAAELCLQITRKLRRIRHECRGYP